MIRTILITEGVCPICERPALDGRTHPRCQTQYSLDGLTSFFRYDGVVREAIKAVKYRLTSDIASEFVGLIPDSSSHNLIQKGSVFFLIPVPLHISRFRERGFNQAEVLGMHFCRRFKIPMITDVLVRKKRTVPQVEMKDREKRLKNMAHVFAVNKASPKHVILFDDVFTTGATMRSAGSVLKRAGVRWVWAVTMAR
ncbi:ComF family protein [Candidatus Gottesmanbacteria bacterium]|nr:ComF family protein [Candidatus Gottesmanbacteria bacterium]